MPARALAGAGTRVKMSEIVLRINCTELHEIYPSSRMNSRKCLQCGHLELHAIARENIIRKKSGQLIGI